MLQVLLEDALRQRGLTDVQVISAGIAAAEGEPASDGARRAMARRGLSLEHHGSTPLAEVSFKGVSLVLTMSERHAAAVRAQGVDPARIVVVEGNRGGVPDPFGGDDGDYEATARVLARAAEAVAEDLAAP